MTRRVATAWAALALLAPWAARSEGLPADLPRLAGIMVAGALRQAIFAQPGQRGTLALGEGDSIGRFKVSAIRPTEVELTTATSRYLLEPSGDGSIRLERPVVAADATADK